MSVNISRTASPVRFVSAGDGLAATVTVSAVRPFTVKSSRIDFAGPVNTAASSFW